MIYDTDGRIGRLFSAFWKYEFNGLSREKIAQQLGIPEGTVSSRISDAHKQLREQYSARRQVRYSLRSGSIDPCRVRYSSHAGALHEPKQRDRTKTR